MGGPFRIDPLLPVHAVKTYALVMPLVTHWRAATCAEVDCANRERGWQTRIDPATTLGAQQLRYIRDQSGRYFTDATAVGDTLVTLIFAAGQDCFEPHRVPLDRDPIHLVRGGDWRGNPRGERRVHVRGEDWVDDFQVHQDALATRLAQG